MGRGLKLSLLVLVLVVFSVLFLGLFGVSCEIWTHTALSGAKKIGSKVILRILYHSDRITLPVESIPYLERFLKLGV